LRAEAGDVASARRTAKAVLTSGGAPLRTELRAMVALADVDLADGRPLRAHRRALIAFERASRAGRRVGACSAVLAVAEACLSLGRLEEARRWTLALLDNARSMRARPLEARAQIVQARIDLRAGSVGAAEEAATGALRIAESVGNVFLVARA